MSGGEVVRGAVGGMLSVGSVVSWETIRGVMGARALSGADVSERPVRLMGGLAALGLVLAMASLVAVGYRALQYGGGSVPALVPGEPGVGRGADGLRSVGATRASRK
jgi:hypothetical protein